MRLMIAVAWILVIYALAGCGKASDGTGISSTGTVNPTTEDVANKPVLGKWARKDGLYSWDTSGYVFTNNNTYIDLKMYNGALCTCKFYMGDDRPTYGTLIINYCTLSGNSPAVYSCSSLNNSKKWWKTSTALKICYIAAVDENDVSCEDMI